MFTGLVEETGKIIARIPSPGGSLFHVEGLRVLEQTVLGDSIMVNGVCLTVTRLEPPQFQVFVSDTTLSSTTFHWLNPGTIVNLERAMTPSQRFGGHIVAGHVDGMGKIRQLDQRGNIFLLQIEASTDILSGLVDKGSVSLDGISLTITSVSSNYFTVTIIPETWQRTNLRNRKIGDQVNIEVDILGKYVTKAVERLIGSKSKIDDQLLREAGFL